MFNATIRENLDPHGYYADLQLWNCLELAQLKEFVNVQLPLGLGKFNSRHNAILVLDLRVLVCFYTQYCDSVGYLEFELGMFCQTYKVIYFNEVYRV